MNREDIQRNQSRWKAVEQLYANCLTANQELLEKAYRKTDELLAFIDDAKQVQSTILKNMQMAGRLLAAIEGTST